MALKEIYNRSSDQRSATLPTIASTPPPNGVAELLVSNNPGSYPSSAASSLTSHTHALCRFLCTGPTSSVDITATALADVSYVITHVPADNFRGDVDSYLLLKTCFDCREYWRAAHVLWGQIGKKALFLGAMHFICAVITELPPELAEKALELVCLPSITSLLDPKENHSVKPAASNVNNRFRSTA